MAKYKRKSERVSDLDHGCFAPYKMWQHSFGLETVNGERVFLSRFSGLSVRAFSMNAGSMEGKHRDEVRRGSIVQVSFSLKSVF